MLRRTRQALVEVGEQFCQREGWMRVPVRWEDATPTDLGHLRDR